MALRDMLAERLDAGGSGEPVAPLAKQYRDTIARIAELSVGVGEESPVDDLLEKRKERRGKSGRSGNRRSASAASS